MRACALWVGPGCFWGGGRGNSPLDPLLLRLSQVQANGSLPHERLAQLCACEASPRMSALSRLRRSEREAEMRGRRRCGRRGGEGRRRGGGGKDWKTECELKEVGRGGR